MQENPLVSIIIPVFNEEKYLGFCLESLEDQTYKNLEIIVVDDESKDKSLKIAKKFGVKILKQKHQGPGAARNIGAKNAEGTILSFLDADIKYDRNYIEKLIKPIIEGEALGTFNKDEYVANADNIWSKCWSFNSNLPINRRLPNNYNETENAFRAIKKNVFLKAGGFNTKEGYTDDSSFSAKTRIFALNAKGAKSYHYNPESLLEVFFSARWIGRSKLFPPNIINLLRFSPFNSIRIGIKLILKGAPIKFMLFKIVYDFGVFTGIFLSHNQTAK